MTRLPLPSHWIQWYIDPNTYETCLKRIMIPREINTDHLTVEVPANLWRGLPPARLGDRLDDVDWQIFLMFDDDESAALFKLTYL